MQQRSRHKIYGWLNFFTTMMSQPFFSVVFLLTFGMQHFSTARSLKSTGRRKRFFSSSLFAAAFTAILWF
jgi:hypothetical protein